MGKRAIKIRGWHCQGNFGDDLLLWSTLDWLASFDEDMHVILRGPFVERFIEEYVNERPQSPLMLDSSLKTDDPILLFAGGGQFFDLRRLSLTSILRNQLSRLIKIVRPGSTSVPRDALAMGLGVGPFSVGSDRKSTAIDALRSASSVWVRDDQSLAWCLQEGIDAKRGADLAFALSEMIASGDEGSPLVADAQVDAIRVGLIPRVWKFEGGDYIDPTRMESVVAELSLSRVDSSILILDEVSDAPFLDASFGPEVVSYSTGGLVPFIDEVRSFSHVVSSRAHGVILSSLLGIPAMSIGIDTKLEWAGGLTGASVVSPQELSSASILEWVENTPSPVKDSEAVSSMEQQWLARMLDASRSDLLALLAIT